MSWWSSVVNGISAVGGYIQSGAQWVWRQVSFSQATTSVVKYTTNTAAQVVDEVIALRSALPSLWYSPNSRKILDSMMYIVVNDLLPVMGVNYINRMVQDYFRQGADEEVVAWVSPYTGVLMILTMTDYAVKMYTLRQGVQTVIHGTVVDMLGPKAFNEHKRSARPDSVCDGNEKCNTQRFYKGSLREPIILLTNDLVTASVSYIPYVGKPISLVLSTFFIGRYVTRMATPERCERHKLMMQESVLALGLGYKASKYVMDYVLSATVGMPDYMVYRTMQHLLLLFNINTAAHMKMPLVMSGEATIPYDPLNVYEAMSRFIADVIFAGLVKRIPIDFKPDESAPPIIPLSTALQFGTTVLNADLERESAVTEQGFFAKSRAYQWVCPVMLQSTRDFINDPVISQYWPQLREGAITSLKIIQQAEKSKTVATLAWAPKSAASAVKLVTGVPKSITEIVLMLSKEKDFWAFVTALKNWFERHGLTAEVQLVESRTIPLNDTVPELPAPVAEDCKPVKSPEEILSKKPGEQVSSPHQLVSEQPLTFGVANPSLLFSRHQRKPKENNKEPRSRHTLQESYFQ